MFLGFFDQSHQCGCKLSVAGVAFGQQTVGQWVGVGQRMTTVTRCGQVKQTQRKFGANGHVLHLLE